ncbi:MAG TPA: SPW repeat protein [Blastocatellia bacterium]|nr:SPW repeat protein [Blastocatellia bacterium]
MKILKPKTHGIIDYAWAGAMIAAPWLFGFNKNREATLASISSGVGILGLSLMTRYPLGAVKVISFPVHGVIETVAGLSTAASPWLCGYSNNESAKWTHLISGLGTLAVVAMTDYAAAEPRRQNRPQFQPGERGAGLAEQTRNQPERERETVDLGPPTEIPAAKRAGFSQV